jgi:hypothetical protein
MATPQVSPGLSPIPFSPVMGAPAMGDLRGIVDRAVSSARATGRDYVGQCHMAAAAVMAVRPDLSAREAFDAVTRLRDS